MSFKALKTSGGNICVDASGNLLLVDVSTPGPGPGPTTGINVNISRINDKMLALFIGESCNYIYSDINYCFNADNLRSAKTTFNADEIWLFNTISCIGYGSYTYLDLPAGCWDGALPLGLSGVSMMNVLTDLSGISMLQWTDNPPAFLRVLISDNWDFDFTGISYIKTHTLVYPLTSGAYVLMGMMDMETGLWNSSIDTNSSIYSYFQDAVGVDIISWMSAHPVVGDLMNTIWPSSIFINLQDTALDDNSPIHYIIDPASVDIAYTVSISFGRLCQSVPDLYSQYRGDATYDLYMNNSEFVPRFGTSYVGEISNIYVPANMVTAYQTDEDWHYYNIVAYEF